MESNKEQLKIQAEEIKAQMDRIEKTISELKADSISSSQENKSTDNQEDTRPIFTMPDYIDSETPHFEKVHRDTDNEQKPESTEDVRKTIEELTAEFNKARKNYLQKTKEQSKIAKIFKGIGQVASIGYYKPDFVKAKQEYNSKKEDLQDRKYFDKMHELADDPSKSQEDRNQELKNFEADLISDEAARTSKLIDARAEVLSERRKALLNKALKSTLPVFQNIGKGFVTSYKVGSKAWAKSGNWGKVIIDKRGEKPADADDLNRQAEGKLTQVKAMEEMAKNEKNKSIKEDILKDIKQFKKDASELRDRAKGEIIYQYRLGQLARSTALFAVGGGFVAGGTGAAMLGLKIARSVGIGYYGAKFLAYNEQAFKTELHSIETNKEKLENDFAGRTNDANYTKEIKKLEKKELMTKIGRNAMKVVIMGLMVGANYASGYAEKGLSNYIHSGDSTETVNKTEQTSTTEETKKSTEPDAKESTRTADEAQKTAEATDEVIKNVETAVSSEGSIATIDELKDKIRAQFPDPSKAPAHIRHIIETDKYTLSEEWGLFNPDEDGGEVDIEKSEEESAMMLKGSKITMDKNWNLTLHNVGKGDTVLSGEGAKVYTGEMFNSNGVENGGATKLGEGEVDINQIPEGEEGYTKLTEGEVDINQNPEGLDPNNLDKAPYADGFPVDENELNKTVWEKNDIKIRSGAYEDANGNIVRLEGKDVTLGADHKIYVDGVVSEELTDKLNLEKSKLLDKTFTTMFGWSNDGAKSSEWLRLQKYDMGTLKNPPTEGFLNDRENNFVKKLLKQAAKTGIDYHGKTASQLVEEIAIKKLG